MGPFHKSCIASLSCQNEFCHIYLPFLSELYSRHTAASRASTLVMQGHLIVTKLTDGQCHAFYCPNFQHHYDFWGISKLRKNTVSFVPGEEMDASYVCKETIEILHTWGSGLGKKEKRSRPGFPSSIEAENPYSSWDISVPAYASFQSPLGSMYYFPVDK